MNIKNRTRQERDPGRRGIMPTPRTPRDMNDRIEEAEKRVREFLENREENKTPTSQTYHQ